MNPLFPRFAPAFVTQSSELIELRLNAAMGDPTFPGAPINTTAAGNFIAGYSQARRPLGATDAVAATTLQGFITAGQDSFNISINDAPPAAISLAGLSLTGANAAN